MAWGYGLKTTRENPSGPWNPTLFVTDIDDGEYILVRGVDFGNGAKEVTVSCAAHLFGGVMEVRTDAPDGPMTASIVVPNTHDKFQELTAPLSGLQGVHDLYFVFRSNSLQRRNLFNFDYWRFSSK